MLAAAVLTDSIVWIVYHCSTVQKKPINRIEFLAKPLFETPIRYMASET